MLQSNEPLQHVHVVGPDSHESIVSEASCPLLKRHGITLLGVSEVAVPYHQARPHAGHAEVQVCFGGSGIQVIGDRHERMGAGQACILPAHGPQHFYALPQQSWGFAWVHYEPQALRLRTRSVRIEPADPEPLRSMILNLHREVLGMAEAPILSLLVDLVHALVLRLVAGDYIDARLQKLAARVDQSLNHPWTVTELASLAGVTPEHLRRLFQAHFGRSPMEWVTRLRMQRAAALLRASAEKLEAVAIEVGYADVHGFSVAFKRVMGVTPARVRSKR